MPVIGLFALSLIVSPGQDGPRAPTPPRAESQAGPSAAPTPPAGPQPQNHEIKAVTGNEGGHPHSGGTAQLPIPQPTVGFRPSAPPPRSSTPPPSGLTGRPVGQPAAAGLGTHVQRGPASPAEAPATPSRSPN